MATAGPSSCSTPKAGFVRPNVAPLLEMVYLHIPNEIDLAYYTTKMLITGPSSGKRVLEMIGLCTMAHMGSYSPLHLKYHASTRSSRESRRGICFPKCRPLRLTYTRCGNVSETQPQSHSFLSMNLGKVSSSRRRCSAVAVLERISYSCAQS